MFFIYAEISVTYIQEIKREREGKKMVFPQKVERIKKASPRCSSEFIPQTISEAETVTLDLTPGLYFL